MRGSELSTLDIKSIYPLVGLVSNFTGLYNEYFTECLSNSNCSEIIVDDS